MLQSLCMLSLLCHGCYNQCDTYPINKGIFSSFDFLWHATDYWHSNVNKNVRNTLNRICFVLNAMIKNQMVDETVLKGILHEHLVGWIRKCWEKNLIENKFHLTSSNTTFVFFFLFLINFVRSQMHPTFRSTSKI